MDIFTFAIANWTKVVSMLNIIANTLEVERVSAFSSNGCTIISFHPYSLSRLPSSTFELGSEHDSSALYAISNASSKKFSFIELFVTVQYAFSMCISGILSVVFQEFQLSCIAASPTVALNVQEFAPILRVRAPPLMDLNLERAPIDRVRCLCNVSESRERMASEKLYEQMGRANLLSGFEIILQDGGSRNTCVTDY
uniref:Uncharacterized protein n=1 Tax=Solanum lycopersicum TaxID=4081 RepID=K4B582_SOLLC